MWEDNMKQASAVLSKKNFSVEFYTTIFIIFHVKNTMIFDEHLVLVVFGFA
jgi:hypothetical protein